MSDQITIEASELLALRETARMYVSQHGVIEAQAETIRVQGEEIAWLRSHKRVMEDEHFVRLQRELSKVTRELDEAYERAAQVCHVMNGSPWHTPTARKLRDAIRALKSEPNLHTKTDEGAEDGGDAKEE